MFIVIQLLIAVLLTIHAFLSVFVGAYVPVGMTIEFVLYMIGECCLLAVGTLIGFQIAEFRSKVVRIST